MEKRVLEVCVDSVESALAAAAGGADRLELCANLIIGGTTPGFALFDAVKQAVDIPVHVLIRPRFGDFLYTPIERQIICREIREFSARGADAVVIGALERSGELDVDAMGAMMQAAEGCPVTLHRAMDVSRDLSETMERAIELGVRTILTSGGAADAWSGRETIRSLVERSGGRVEVLIGGGVNGETISRFLGFCPGAASFHMSGKEVLPSGMAYRNGLVNMGLPGISEFQIWRTSEQAVRRAREELDKT